MWIGNARINAVVEFDERLFRDQPFVSGEVGPAWGIIPFYLVPQSVQQESYAIPSCFTIPAQR
jgi:hypothetical protein